MYMFLAGQQSVGKHEPCVEDLVMDVDGYVETYISAVEDPNHFWLQIVRENSAALDRLVEEMSDFYGHCIDKEVLKLQFATAWMYTRMECSPFFVFLYRILFYLTSVTCLKGSAYKNNYIF